MSAELDQPKNLLIAGIVVATVAMTGGLVFMVSTFFDFQVRAEISEKVLTHKSAALQALRAEEQAKLTRYRWVDQKAGVVSIPIDKAVELTLKEWPGRPSGAVVPPPVPVAAPPGGVAPAGAIPPAASPGTPAAAPANTAVPKDTAAKAPAKSGVE